MWDVIGLGSMSVRGRYRPGSGVLGVALRLAVVLGLVVALCLAVVLGLVVALCLAMAFPMRLLARLFTSFGARLAIPFAQARRHAPVGHRSFSDDDPTHRCGGGDEGALLRRGTRRATARGAGASGRRSPTLPRGRPKRRRSDVSHFPGGVWSRRQGSLFLALGDEHERSDTDEGERAGDCKQPDHRYHYSRPTTPHMTPLRHPAAAS
jgi:hypothetical protein